MAALSVHMARLGRKPLMPSSTQTSRKRSRRRELAATPPPRHRPLAPTERAAARALATSTSTTASWNEADTSAASTSGFLRTWFTTAVFRPLKEKSNVRSEEHTSELQSLMRISYAVFCLKKKKNKNTNKTIIN